MKRTRVLIVSVAALAGASILTACDNLPALVQPCFSKFDRDGILGWNPLNGVGRGSWNLVTIDNNPLPHKIPFSHLTPLGEIIADGGSLQFDTYYRGFADDCESLRGEKGTATASYSFTQKGIRQPNGTYGGSFDADYDANVIVLSAGEHKRNAHVTSWDSFGRPDEITAITQVEKWGFDVTFTLVFRR